jgi:hypothetical protein
MFWYNLQNKCSTLHFLGSYFDSSPTCPPTKRAFHSAFRKGQNSSVTTFRLRVPLFALKAPPPRPSDRSTRHRERMEQIERDEGVLPDRGLRSRRGSASDMDPEPWYVPSDQRYVPSEPSSRAQDEVANGWGPKGGEVNGGWQENGVGGKKGLEGLEEGLRGEGTSLPPIAGRRKELKEETR